MMRRIYESDALRTDEDDHHAPSPREKRRSNYRNQPLLNVTGISLSPALLPGRVQRRALSVDVSSPKSEYPVGTEVPFVVTMRNRLPFKIRIPVQSPLCWTWSVDDYVEASHVELRNPPEQRDTFEFDRGERKTFRKTWNGLFRVSESEWEEAACGDHVISVDLNVEQPRAMGLHAETTVELVPE